MQCPRCSAQLRDDATFCFGCNAQLANLWRGVGQEQGNGGSSLAVAGASARTAPQRQGASTLKRGCLGCMALFGTLVVLAALLAVVQPRSETPQTGAQRVAVGGIRAAARDACETFVLPHLHQSATAVFVDVAVEPWFGDDRFNVAGRVDAQNVHGEVEAVGFTCLVERLESGQWRLSDLQFLGHNTVLKPTAPMAPCWRPDLGMCVEGTPAPAPPARTNVAAPDGTTSPMRNASARASSPLSTASVESNPTELRATPVTTVVRAAPTHVPSTPDKTKARYVTVDDLLGPYTTSNDGANVALVGVAQTVDTRYTPPPMRLLFNDAFGSGSTFDVLLLGSGPSIRRNRCYLVYGIVWAGVSWPANLPPNQYPKALIHAYAWEEHVPAPSEGCRAGFPTLVRPEGLPTAHVVTVVNGETLEVVQGNEQLRIGLLGVQMRGLTTERKDCYGKAAAERIRALLDGATVGLETDPIFEQRNRTARPLRYVWLADGRLLNQVLIAEGYADESSSAPSTFGLLPHRYFKVLSSTPLDETGKQRIVELERSCGE